MSDDRRYDEQEIERIFEAAATPAPPRRRPAQARGLTLAELQAIGREVGLPPERIAEAAASLDRSRSVLPRRTMLGMPVGVGRTVELPRALSDREWALLVGELRETFGAHGSDSSQGELRQWTNGNLHASVEPTIDGWRLRLGTFKGDAASLNTLGIGGILGAAAAAIGMLAVGEPVSAGLALIAAGGGGAFAFNALRLPRWASERERQMEYVIERVRAILDTGG